MTQTWSVEVELNASDVSDDTVDEMHSRLDGCHPAIGAAPSGNLSARIFVDAHTARQAVDRALDKVIAAAERTGIGHTVLAIHLVTEEELDRILGPAAGTRPS